MTQRLIIIMPSHEGGPGLWGVVDGNRVIKHGREAPPSNENSKETVAILSGQSLRIYPHELPATSKRDRLRAAGFSIEDKIAVPLEHVHIALSDDRIAVMDKDELAANLAQLKEAGLTPSKAIADFEALAGIEGNVALLDRVVTTGPLGHAMDKNWANEASIEYSDEILLAEIGAKLEQNDTLNILQNGFSPKSGFQFGWRKLAPLGGLAASNNELQLRLIYPSFESAGELEQAIRSAGGQLITGGVREQSGRFIGEATLRGGAS